MRPKNIKNNPESEKLVQAVIAGMLEKKAEDITLVDLRNIKNAVTDYFVICSGNSSTQIDALFGSVEEIVFKQTGSHPWRSEGRENKEWILLDYVDVVAHIFKDDRRKFYALEQLWGDAEITHIQIQPAQTP